MTTKRKFLTPARSNALSKVFLNVFQLLLVGMFLSEAFGNLMLAGRLVAVLLLVMSLVLGAWLATDKMGEG